MSDRFHHRRLAPRSGRRFVAAVSTLTVLAAGGFAVARAAAPTGQAGMIQTMAGSMQNYQQWGPCSATSCPGDGGPATAAQLYNPRALAFAPNGDIYIADALNERIRKVDAGGVISTFAGTGAADVANKPQNGVQSGPPGNNGDNGDAGKALFNQPHGLAVDSHGNVYVSDSNDNKVRRIDAATHIITTIAGQGDPKAPACPGGTSVCEASTSGLKFPKSMFMASGDKLYVADSGNNMVRMIDLTANPPTIKTIAGTTQSSHFNGDGKPGTQTQLWGPQGVAVDSAGNVYIADSNNNLVRKVDAATGTVTTLAGDTATAAAHAGDGPTATPWDSDSAGDGGQAVNAHLDGPRGIAVDSGGNIYIGQESGSDKTIDTTGSRIRRIDPSGTITTIAGNGKTNGRGAVPGDPGPAPAGQAEFNTMHDLTLDANGNLWIADSKNNLVRVLFDPAHTPAGGAGDPAPGGGTTVTTQPSIGVASGTGKSGYWMLGSDGQVYGFGDAHRMGDAAATLPAGAKATHLEPTPDDQGYWIVDDAGDVYAYGDAQALGNVPAGALGAHEKVTSLSATPSGRGYWIFTTKGKVFTFGDAQNFGDMSTTNLNGAIQSSIPTATGQGYYMVGSDGGVFAFGDAVFHGSTGNLKLNQPVQSLVPTSTNQGYWLVASDGGIFAFGDAPFRGSMGATRLNKPVVGMVRYGDGYLMVAADGGIFDFSSKPFLGSLGANPPAHPIVFAATIDS